MSEPEIYDEKPEYEVDPALPGDYSDAPVGEGQVKLFHPEVAGSFVATQAAYEECWRDKGWFPEDTSSVPTDESPADDESD